jgi:proteic killer suppression protein
MNALRAAANLMVFWPSKSGPDRCHELTGGKRSGQLSVDLDYPYRLIFMPDYDPIPLHEDGGLDWSQVAAVKILGIENTHE